MKKGKNVTEERYTTIKTVLESLPKKGRYSKAILDALGVSMPTARIIGATADYEEYRDHRKKEMEKRILNGNYGEKRRLEFLRQHPQYLPKEVKPESIVVEDKPAQVVREISPAQWDIEAMKETIEGLSEIVSKNTKNTEDLTTILNEVADRVRKLSEYAKKEMEIVEELAVTGTAEVKDMGWLLEKLGLGNNAK